MYYSALMNELPYEGATAEELRHPLVRHFLDIHNMFRNELAAMLSFVDELRAGDKDLAGPETKARIRMVISAGAQYTQVLRFHHHGESSMLFPMLADQGLEAEAIKRLETEHDEIGVLIDKFGGSIRNLSAVEPAVLDNELHRLSQALRDHLTYEETLVCPFLARIADWSK